MGRVNNLKARIQRKIKVVNGCWLWQGSHSGYGRGGGYGRMSVNGCTMAVHRVSYMLEHGPIPTKRQVDHLCKNRLCCNPDHLELVTHKENQRRRACND